MTIVCDFTCHCFFLWLISSNHLISTSISEFKVHFYTYDTQLNFSFDFNDTWWIKMQNLWKKWVKICNIEKKNNGKTVSLRIFFSLTLWSEATIIGTDISGSYISISIHLDFLSHACETEWRHICTAMITNLTLTSNGSQALKCFSNCIIS